MVFIFKDYNKKVMMVTAVPMTMLDHVKVVIPKIILNAENIFFVPANEIIGTLSRKFPISVLYKLIEINFIGVVEQR